MRLGRSGQRPVLQTNFVFKGVAIHFPRGPRAIGTCLRQEPDATVEVLCQGHLLLHLVLGPAGVKPVDFPALPRPLRCSLHRAAGRMSFQLRAI
jgi:hypothetical protein